MGNVFLFGLQTVKEIPGQLASTGVGVFKFAVVSPVRYLGTSLVKQGGKSIATSTTKGVYRVGGKVVSSVSSRVGTANARAVRIASNRISNVVTLAGYISRLYFLVQGLVFGLVTYVIFRNIGAIVDFLIALFYPISLFFYYIDATIQDFRNLINQGKSNVTITSRSTLADRVKFGVAIFVDLLLILIQETITLVSIYFQTALTFLIRIARKIFPYAILLFCVVVFNYLQQNYIGLVDTVNQVTVLGETGFKQLSRFGNITLDIYDTLMPLKNVEFIDIVQRAKLLCYHLCPDEIKPTTVPGRRLFEALEGKSSYFEKDTNPSMKRRKLMESNSMQVKFKALKKLVNKLAFAKYAMNQFDLRVMGFYLLLIKPFIENIAVAFEPIERFISKLLCMTLGGLRCTAKELFYFALTSAVDFLNSFLPFKVGYPASVACGSDELRGVSAQVCGGKLSDTIPSGAVFTSLVDDGSGNRRLLLETPEQPVLECKQDLLDGAWVETLDGKQVHRSHVNKCPLSRQVFRDEFSNVKQFNMMNIDKECYTVCLHNVKYESCHNQFMGHVRRFLGSCDEETKLSEHEARRVLNSIFPDSFFGWNAGPVQATTSASRETENVFLPFTGNDGASPVTSDSLVTSLKQMLRENPKFTVAGIECSIKYELSLEQLFVNAMCIGLRIAYERGPSLQTLMDNFFPAPRQSKRRMLYDSATVMEKRRESFSKWTKKLFDTKTEMVDSVSLVRKYVRLLQATDQTQAMSDRVDDMIDIVNYRPSRRVLEAELASTDGILPRSSNSMLDEIEVKDIGTCEGENMYPCYNGGCVPQDERDTCEEVNVDDPETSTLQRVQYYIHRATLVNVDPEEIFQGEKECQAKWETDIDNVPVTLTNLNVEEGGGEYCVGTSPPFPYRFPDVEVQGINRYVSQGCHVNGINTCQCSMYFRTSIQYSAVTLDFTDADTRIMFVNAFISLQLIGYVVLWQFMPTDIWYSLCSIFTPYVNIPVWVLYMFSDLGVRGVPVERRGYCWVAYLGSLLYMILVLMLLYDFFCSLGLFMYWYWSMVQRLAAFVGSSLRRRKVSKRNLSIV